MRIIVVFYFLLWVGISYGAPVVVDPTKPVLQTPANLQTDYDDALFVWKASTDADGDPVLYDFYLSSDPANVTLFQGGIQDGFENNHILAFADGDDFYVAFLQSLLPNTTYYWKVVARDGNGPGVESDTWSFSTSNTNYHAPTKPVNPLPAAGAVNISIFPMLEWQASTDGDGDPVVYKLYLDTIPGASRLIAADIASPGFKISTALKGNAKYYWKVVADDNRGKQTEGDVWSFTTANNTPRAANLLSPENNAKNTDYNIGLSWQKAFDEDNDVAYYEVWYGSTEPPANKMVTTGTKISLNLQQGTRFYWKVVTVDQHGARAESVTWNFTTKSGQSNQPPLAPQLLAPASNTNGTGLQQPLRWNASSDADNDPVFYEVYAASDPAALTRVASGLTATEFTPAGLKPATTYYWKVVAYDGKGGVAESEVWNFTTTVQDVGITNLSVYYRYPHATQLYQFQSTSLAPAFNVDSTSYSVKGRTTMTQAVAVVLYYSNPSATVSFDLPPSFTVTQNITYNFGLPANATAIYQIEGNFASNPRVVVRLQAGAASRAFAIDLSINKLPTKPEGLTPANRAENVSVFPVFTWKNGDDPEGGQMVYRFLMGTSADNLTPAGVVVNAKTFRYQGAALLNSMKYYWKVVALDSHAESVESDVYSFVTERRATYISSPLPEYPRTVSTYMETDFDLVWRYDPSRNATYEIYFDVVDPPRLMAQHVAGTSYPIRNLTHNTTYYWKVVAHDQDGKMTESPVQKFRTKPLNGNETGSFTDTRDGQVYQWVKIGNQQWMVHNLAYEPHDKDGYTGYSYFLSTNTGGKEYFVPGHDEATRRKNGYLYNWMGALNAPSNPNPQVVRQGVCPAGWHVPNAAEWEQVYPALTGVANGNTIDRNTLHYDSWSVTGKESAWLNHSGLSLLPSGYKSGAGFIVTSNAGQIWLADTNGPSAVDVRYTYDPANDQFRVLTRTDTRNTAAASVRCLKNTNEAPAKPVLKSPSHASSNADFNVSLEWFPSTDADGDPVQYIVYLDENASPLEIVADGITSTTHTVNGLGQAGTYYWKVVARDSHGNSAESEVRSFSTRLNPGNAAPAAPQLLQPADGATGVSRTPTLRWSAVADPEGSPVTYDVYTGGEPTALTLVAAGIDVTSWVLDVRASATQLFWKVIARDGNGGQSESTVYSFTTLNNAPAKPDLLTPGNSTQGVLNTQELSWRSVTDPDGDNVVYSVYAGTSASAMAMVASELTNTYYDFVASLANTSYYWQIVASDAKGGNTASDIWSFKTYDYISTNATTLKTPVNNAVNIGLTPDLEWNPYPGTLHTYDLYVGTSVPVLVAHDLTTTTFRLNGLQGGGQLAPHTTYQWKIVLKNAFGAINETATWSFTTRNTAPSAPVLTSPTNGSVDQPYEAILQWQVSTDADNDPVFYDLYLNTSSSGPGQRVAAGLTEPSFTLPPFVLQPHTTYYWRVVAKDQFGGTTSSATRQFTTRNNTQNSAPSAPALRAPLSYSGSMSAPVTLMWEASMDIDQDELVYDIYAGTDPALNTPVATALKTLTYDLVAPLQPHTRYFWKVVVRDNKGGEANSVVWNFSTPNAPPSSPALVSPANNEQLTFTTATLTWLPATDPDGDAITYTVYLDNNPQPVTKVAQGLNVPDFNTQALDNNKTYYWKVVAKDLYGGEASSAVYKFSSDNDEPSVPVLQSPSLNAFVSVQYATLSWAASTDPEGAAVTYEVFLDTDPVPVKKMATVYNNTLSFVTPALTENTTYFWKVVAKDGYGGISESAIWNFTYKSTAANLPPTAPVLQNPADQSTGLGRDVTVTWLNSVDPEGGQVSYDIYLSLGGAADVLWAQGLASTNYTFYTLEPGKKFYWKVVAKDNAGNSNMSTIWQFTTASHYKISGTVTNETGAPLGSVTLNGFPGSVTTNVAGYYEAELPPGWTGTIVADLGNYVFQPEKIEIAPLQGDLGGQNFTGIFIGKYRITGTIKDLRDRPVQVELTGFPGVVTTDENGVYEAIVPPGWSGEVTPVSGDHTFLPEKRSYQDVQSDVTGQDYSATYTGKYTISGFIKDDEGRPVAEIELEGFEGPVKTDAGGHYIAEVAPGWSGTVTPVSQDHTFDPASRQYQDVQDNYDEQNYTSVLVDGIDEKDLSLAIYPNPTRGLVKFEMEKALTEKGLLVIFSADGTVMARYDLPAGVTSVYWNGKNKAGAEVSTGLYHCRVISGTQVVAEGRIMVVR